MTTGRARGARRVVLFDLDDTLVDHTGPLRAGLRALRRDYPAFRRRPLGALVGEYGRLLDAAHPRIVRGTLSPDVARRERFRDLFAWVGAPATPRQVTDAIDGYQEAYRARRGPVPGAAAILRALHGRVTVGVLSNNRRLEQAEKIDATGLGPYLDRVVTSEELPWSKPDPRAFREAVRRTGGVPRWTTMVGDSWATDVAGALEAGLAAVWLNRFGAPPPPGHRGVPILAGFEPVGTAVRRILAARPRARGGDSS